ncbi:hypothetical protein [Streptomyces flavofungini]|uniref:hypothetical protein n=1 Tax=Streptomyces flavofungini TaxID=68200 RepID=UPI0034E03541
METATTLVHLDSPFINFRDHDFGAGSHGYRWVNVKRFRLASGTGSDRDVLAALIAHPQFRDTYDGGGVQDWPRHGQWWLERITPDTYESIGADAATELVRAWAAQHGDVPESLLARLGQELYTPLRQATACYVLGHLPEEAQHDYGPLHTDYHELVLIDRRTSTVTLAVAADD